MAVGEIVHVIDDDDAARDSLAFLLSTADLKVRAWPSATAFLDGGAQPAGGCIVTDIRMPGIDGIELLRRLKEGGSDLPVIVITGHGDVPLAVEAMKLGAVDFLEKPYDEEGMLGAVQRALARHSDSVSTGAHKAGIRDRLAALSAREREVLEGLVAGQPNKVIAHNLGISPRTVEVYRANVMTKMQAKSLSELVRMAMGAAAP